MFKAKKIVETLLNFVGSISCHFNFEGEGFSWSHKNENVFFNFDGHP